MSAFARLMAFQRDTEALELVMERLRWDREAAMPRGAAQQRSEEMAALEAVLHARRTDPRLGEWLAEAQPADDFGARAVELIGKAHARAVRVPGRLAAEIARATSIAQGVWAEARERDDVALFLPRLAEVVTLKREEAAALVDGAGAGGGPDAPHDVLYDALLEDYEPDTSAAEVAALFDRMRPRLVALRNAVLERPEPPALSGHFPREGQLRLARGLALAFGYDFAHGRMDEVVHPFCSGGGADVRITTRTVEEEPFNCVYSIIHEAGHAGYEQAIDPGYRLTPLGRGVSMGVHESQARLYENQIGRSRAFCRWLHGQMVAEFGEGGSVGGLKGAEAFYAAVNRIGRGFIRTEADEVQYNLHIMMRFDLERALMAGDLGVEDLEAAWNDRFAEDFGYAVARPRDGMLQDVHWSIGLFGYFPTYTLGNVYAGCLMAALRGDLPDLDAALERGDTTPAVGWLREKLQRHGALRAPGATIAHATGSAPVEGPLLDYLEAKFGELYGL